VTGTAGAGPMAAGRAGRAGRKPPRRWLVVALTLVPCLLTLPVAAFGVLLSALVGITTCFDTCGQNHGWFQSSAGTATMFAVELLLGLTAFVILIAGLVARRRRRVLRRAGWVVFLLSFAAAALLVWSP
jgi:hypothetical protein